MRERLLAAAATAALAASCYIPTHGLVERPLPGLSGEIAFTYLGAGGWAIEAGGEMLLTAPLFSNPGWIRILRDGVLEANEERIAEVADRFGLDRAVAILVGHAHYDHAMDLPALVRNHATSATVYGSRTLRYQLLPFDGVAPEHVVAVESRAGTHARVGTWTDVGARFRFMPLESGHTPQTSTIHKWQGHRDEPMDHEPRTANDWLEGQVFSFLVEVLDARGEAVARIYYQDSATKTPLGMPHPDLLDPDLPTVAILTAPGHKYEPGFPGKTLKYLEPDYVLVGHWEEFVTDWDWPERPMPTTDFSGFRTKIDTTGYTWWAPTRGTRFVFRPWG